MHDEIFSPLSCWCLIVVCMDRFSERKSKTDYIAKNVLRTEVHPLLNQIPLLQTKGRVRIIGYFYYI